MATPKIGYDYRLDVRESLYDEPITWVNNRSKRLYSTWEEIEGRIVTVKALTRVMTTFYIVSLLEHPKDPFYVSKKLLMELTRRLPIPCSCDLQALLNQGCRCGAFKKEQAAKNKSK
jgi:hypothetical protein